MLICINETWDAKPTLTVAEYRDREDLMDGFCTVCEDFTRHMTEADVRIEDGYECDDCGAPVVGTMTALEEGRITIKVE